MSLYWWLQAALSDGMRGPHSGAAITTSWNNQQVLQWTDTANPWISGKVGVRQCASRHTHWDNSEIVGLTGDSLVALSMGGQLRLLARDSCFLTSGRVLSVSGGKAIILNEDSPSLTMFDLENRRHWDTTLAGFFENDLKGKLWENMFAAPGGGEPLFDAKYYQGDIYFMGSTKDSIVVYRISVE